jgi:hypothetical protein
VNKTTLTSSNEGEGMNTLRCSCLHYCQYSVKSCSGFTRLYNQADESAYQLPSAKSPVDSSCEDSHVMGKYLVGQFVSNS